MVTNLANGYKLLRITLIYAITFKANCNTFYLSLPNQD